MESEPVNKLLVICRHNAGRSQAVEGLFNDRVRLYPKLAGKWEAISAGTNPGEEINPFIVQALSETGINLDPQRHHPKALDSDFIRGMCPSIRRVVVACNDECVLPPEIPSDVPRESWNLVDPHGQSINIARAVIKMADRKVMRLLTDLAKSA